MRPVHPLILSLVLLLAPAARAEGVAARPLGKADLPKGVRPPDGLDKALGWSDKNGDNVLLFATKEKTSEGRRSRYLTVQHVAVKDGAATTLRTVRETVEDCDVDLTLEVVDDATAVTDLDGDGVAEATFAYRVSCKGDVSPDTIKVLVLENQDKFILRGDDKFELEPGKTQGGTFKPEPAPAKWPPAFLEHAKRTFKKIVK